MSRRLAVFVALAAALTIAAPAAADPAMTVTATGTAQIKVKPKNRNSEASIQAAVEAAHKAGISGALDEAHEYALEYAQAAGLTLGSVISVTDVQTNGPFYGPGFFYGPFGPNQYCGELTQPIFKVVAGKRKVTGSKRVHRCFVPRFEPVSLSVTYSAT